MATNKVLYLSRVDVEAVGISMSEIIEALQTVFKEKGEGRTEMPPKPLYSCHACVYPGFNVGRC